MSRLPAVVVMAKAPQAGRSKTRLCPPCRPEQASALAEAALRDTLDAVLATPGVRRVVALDGSVGSWLPRGFEVVGQEGDGLDERLARAVERVGGPVAVIGMDTPQVTPEAITVILGGIGPGRAVLAPAADGGWWALGLHRADGAVFRDVPMSRDDTGARQTEQLRRCGLDVRRGAELIDIDHWPDALAVAAAAPRTRTAALVAQIEASLAVPR
ncbi:MAG: DUF2064 domain-containing protein [Acidimicrobiales bacterium]|nr:DUF2064 domain-containing protein [Acidimicrobiales bacterium]